MILLPLGFGRKLPQIPWVTVAIAMVTVCFSIPYFKHVRAIETAQDSAALAAGYGAIAARFALAHCQESKLTPLECRVASELISARFSDEKNSSQQIIKKLKDGNSGAVSVAEFSQSAKRVVTFARSYVSNPNQLEPRLKAAAGFGELSAAYSTIQVAVRNIHKNNAFLTLNNRGFKQLLLAQWIHSNWTHLLGNLFVFLALAAVLELRMGAVAFLGLYFAGGTVGLLTQLLLFKDPDIILLGASANISAVTGAFFIFFFHRPMKVLLSFIVYNRILDCPTWLMIPVLFLLGDVAGAIEGGGGVAHVAHLGGFFAGAAMAYFMKSTDRLHPTYIYPAEYNWHVELRDVPRASEKIALAERILKFNNANYLVKEEGLEIAVAQLSKPEPSSKRFLKDHLANAVNESVARKDVKKIEEVLKSYPLGGDLFSMLGEVEQKNLIALSERQLKTGNWFLALRLFDSLRFHSRVAKSSAAFEETMRNVLTHLAKTGADLSILSFYKQNETKTTFGNLIQEFDPNLNGAVYERSG